MNTRTLIFTFLTMCFGISCSKVQFSNAPTTACAQAAECVTDAGGETFYQDLAPAAPNNQVDILIVDDDSVSMLQRQQNLAAHFPGFIQLLNGLDWRIAIVTTDNTTLDPNCNTQICQQINSLPQIYKDHKNAKLVPFLSSPTTSTGLYYIDSHTPNAQTLLTNTIQRPESIYCSQHPEYLAMCLQLISGDERGIYSAIRNVTGSQQPSFIRSGAQLHVIVVSDEDERSNGGGYPGYAIVAGQDRPQDLVAAFGGRHAQVHSIVNVPAGYPGSFNFDDCVSAQINNLQTDNYNGCFYIQTANQTSGVVASINTSNYTTALSSIAQNIQNTNITQFAFSCVPDSVTIHQDGSLPLPNGYYEGEIYQSITGSTMQFNPAITYGTAIRLEWHCPRT